MRRCLSSILLFCLFSASLFSAGPGLDSTGLRSTMEKLQAALSKQDSTEVLQNGIELANLHYAMNATDSASHYMSLIEPYEQSAHDNMLAAKINVMKGTLAVTQELNYTKAIMHFLKGYHCLDKDDTGNRIGILSNIIHLFYIRSDKNISKYISDIRELSENIDSTSIYFCSTLMAMAEFHYLTKDYDKAFVSALEAKNTAIQQGYLHILPIANLIMADICHYSSQEIEAETYYREAIEYSEYEEPGIVALIYLHYGKFFESQHKTAEAIQLYTNGLNISYRYKNAEFREKLLDRLAELYYIQGDTVSSLAFYRQHHAYSDSLSLHTQEQDFYYFIDSYQELEHQNELYAKEVTVLKLSRTILMLASAFLIVIIIFSFFWQLYSKQKKQYRQLVLQYQNRVQPLQTTEDSGKTENKQADNTGTESYDPASGILFKQIEQMMTKDKVFTMKDLSLDKMAELLGTNRTYISKAINSFASMSFYNYLDMYRIKEATSILSSKGKGSMPFKQLADIVGYNSDSVFYKAFYRETGCTPGQYRKGCQDLSAQKTENR